MKALQNNSVSWKYMNINIFRIKGSVMNIENNTMCSFLQLIKYVIFSFGYKKN